MRINANGIDIDYDVSGTDDGPVVVLSHSLGSSRVMWDPQMPALEAAYRVVSYDTRGHGGSSAPAEAYSLDQLGDDAMALLDALEIESAHWVGLSMGGMIGQNLALRQNGRLDSLVLCDTSAQIPAEARSTWDDRIAAADSGGMAPLAEPTLERWFTPDYLGGDPPAVAPIRQQFLDTPPAGFIGCCHALKPLDYLDRLGEIRLPTLIIVGEDDPGTPVAASEAMHERIAGSELAILPSAAHLSNIEQADAFNQALLGFLDGR
ncbi:MAG: 3-oxoadipate enol-lactonase [Alphaproteobacteria bacterium]|jgi:3-oxoadipate enol-lactonase|nr:3-oxoadipate enol-lactonase [Alphaproteobacteria bacterium]MDP6565545.1 3-oxoadipate enol-lactonase [Alphaproteobacteria bacterium]MDP6812084.1 3-oxoadipate enol-lactonase [Alphaproteobacteria bacterium]